jgi:hypothetical protein
MKEFIKKLFKKKFKIEIARDNSTTTDKLFVIQYAYYKFIPNWRLLRDNFHIISPINRAYYGSDYIYLTARFTYQEAKEKIKTLNSIEDVYKIHNDIYRKIQLELSKEYN